MWPEIDTQIINYKKKSQKVVLCGYQWHNNKNKTLVNLRDRVAFSPFLVFSLFSDGIKQSLKASGSCSNRLLNMSRVRIWKGKYLRKELKT